MSQNFLPCDRDQSLLLPPDLREWLPEDHLAWFVIEAVGELELADFYAAYRQDGHGAAAHDPEMMVALLLYAYARGERSSRLIERRCAEDVAYRVICAGARPDHATIARFRARHEADLAALFDQVLALCAKAGLLRAGTIALDGTKVRANASGMANATYERIAREILADAARIDAAEDELYGAARGDELPPELADPASRRARLREAKRQLDREHEQERARAEAHNARVEADAEARRRGEGPNGRPRKPRPVPEAPGGRVNLTDPDSRPVKTPQGFIQGYNAQAAATADQIVVCAEVQVGGTDQGLLEPMAERALAAIEAAGAEAPARLLADAGYWSAAQIEALRRRGIDPLVSPDARAGRRTASRQALARELRERLDSPDGRALYRARAQIIEPIFGQLKANRRMDRFLRRGLAACRSEWRLITATHNLLKLHGSGLRPIGA